MDELIDILDAEGNPTGRTATKSEAHKSGWPHRTVHVWLFTSAGEVLLQQRGRNKDTHPLLWDVSVAGHVGAGEDIKQSAIREVEEEVGLTIDTSDLIEIGVFPSLHRHSDSLIDHEFHHCFMSELRVPINMMHRCPRVIPFRLL